MAFKTLTADVLEQLREALPGMVYYGDDISEEYSHDEMLSAGVRLPDAVIKVKTTEDVSAACKILYDNDIPIIPRGAGTGLAGGCTPLYGGVVIDISKMNKILSWDPDNSIVRIEAGVYLHDLAAA